MSMAIVLAGSDLSSAQDCQLLCRASRARCVPPQTAALHAWIPQSVLRVPVVITVGCKPRLGSLQQCVAVLNRPQNLPGGRP